MDEQTKRSMIRKYFRDKPTWPYLLIGLSFLLIASSKSFSFIYIAGAIIGAIGTAGLYSSFKGIPTEQQLDEWLKEDLIFLIKRALKKLGIKEEELIKKPEILTNIRLSNTGGAEIFFKKGKDNLLRFTPIDVYIINFTENQLLIYNCVLDFAMGKLLNENTKECFYQDIVSISINNASQTVDIPKIGVLQLKESEFLTITTRGGPFISILLRDPILISKIGGGEIPTSKVERIIQIIREIVREKKA